MCNGFISKLGPIHGYQGFRWATITLEEHNSTTSRLFPIALIQLFVDFYPETQLQERNVCVPIVPSGLVICEGPLKPVCTRSLAFSLMHREEHKSISQRFPPAIEIGWYFEQLFCPVFSAAVERAVSFSSHATVELMTEIPSSACCCNSAGISPLPGILRLHRLYSVCEHASIG